jgi:hypothetical protein
VVSSFEYGDEPSGSGATRLVNQLVSQLTFKFQLFKTWADRLLKHT